MDTLGRHIAKNSNIQTDQDVGNITAKDAFHPQKLAEHANALVNGLVLEPPGSARPPDTILIEQQRFRTMGASAVQEWALRVNMLEAMLWPLLRRAQDKGDLSGHVYSVSPATTSRWWESQSEISTAAEIPTKAANSTRSSRLIKQQRVDRVSQCLQGKALMVYEDAEITSKSYMERLERRHSRKTARKKVGAEELVRKVDLRFDGTLAQRVVDLSNSELRTNEFLR